MPSATTKKASASRNLSSKPQPAKAAGAAALIAVAQRALEKNNLQAAADYAAAASAKAPILDDYAQYIRAQAEYSLKNYGEVSKAATRVFNQTPLSPLVGTTAAIAVRALLDGDHPKQALVLVKKFYDRIPQPEADLLLARSFEATGDLLQAAEYYQRVYYNFPSAQEATDAANALVTLQQQLGEAYPPPMPQAMLGRAEKLIKKPDAARIEYTAAIPQLAGVGRDKARVRLGEVDYLSGKTQAAYDYLKALKVDESDVDAQRLSYLIRCARKLDKHSDVKEYLNHLEQQHANSLWRLDALIFVADQARVDNDANTYLPLYRACAVTFPKDPRSAWCHWRVAYESYRTGAADAYDVLRKHIELYPSSTDVNNALYFLGRFEERKNQLAVARACYDQLISRFPNTYFAMVARTRLKDPGMQAATPDASILEFLRSVGWQATPEFPSFTPGTTAQKRIDRSNLLDLAGLDDLAEGELKFGPRATTESRRTFTLITSRNLPYSEIAPIRRCDS